MTLVGAAHRELGATFRDGGPTVVGDAGAVPAVAERRAEIAVGGSNE